MTRQMLVRLAVLAAGILLGAYFYLNAAKLNVAGDRWADMAAGPSAVTLRLMLDSELLLEKKIKGAEVFDAQGRRQLSFVRLPKDAIDRVRLRLKDIEVLLGEDAVPLVAPPNRPYLLATLTDRKIYLLAEDELEPMMIIISSERINGQRIDRCVTAGLCQSMSVSSNDWGPVVGPFLDTELKSHRRSMPKGRWVGGPQATLTIVSDRLQRVVMLVDQMSTFPDQTTTFSGSIVAKAQQRKGATPPLYAGGEQFFSHQYIVYMKLQPGNNELVMKYSKWRKPSRAGAASLAVYLTGLTLKRIEE